MKILFFLLMVFVVSATTIVGNKSRGLQIGDKAVLTDVKMTDVSGKEISIADAKQINGVLVMFSSNTCPFVLRWEDRYNSMKIWADENNVGMIVLNSNYQNRNGVDSFEAMKRKAEEGEYRFYYVVDKDSRIANAFGGQTTPHVFLFDKGLELVYKGAIDDSYKSAANVIQAYVKDALTRLGEGQKLTISETKPVGCSIKRKTD